MKLSSVSQGGFLLLSTMAVLLGALKSLTPIHAAPQYAIGFPFAHLKLRMNIAVTGTG
ncbi:MAG TPA: hypothetical protein VN833_15285 [Candidatus Acidoferrales bacterium]|jgi:hypothetical protein|nr:hypothetical protein [Candidatus Acidoferrales bacterium]